MQKYNSIFAYAAQRILPKLSLLLAVTAAVEISLFKVVLHKYAEQGIYNFTLNDVIDEGHIMLVFGLSAVCMYALLCGICSAKGSNRMRYTLYRLPLSERFLPWIWMLCNVFVIMIFWAFQLGLLLILSRIFMHEPHIASSYLGVFLAAYEVPVFHSLLPLGDIWLHIENIILIISAAVSASLFALKQLHGRFNFAAPLLAVCTFVSFSRSATGSFVSGAKLFMLAACIVIGLYSLVIMIHDCRHGFREVYENA